MAPRARLRRLASPSPLSGAVMALCREAKRSPRPTWRGAALAMLLVVLVACGDSDESAAKSGTDGGQLPVATGGAGGVGGGAGGGGALDASVVSISGGSGGTQAMGDAAVPLDATMAMPDTAVPPPDPPPADNARAVHLMLERDGQLFVARVVPAEGYVGPAADALPVDPSDVDGEPVLWARDEGPRLVVDLGEAGVYANDGDGWLQVDEGLPQGMYVERLLDVTPDVDRVLLMKRAYDMTTFMWMLGGGLYALDGSEIYGRMGPQNQSQQYGALSADGSLFAVSEQTSTGAWQTSVRRTEDAAERAVLPLSLQVFAVFEDSLIAGNVTYPQWYGFDGMLLPTTDIEPLMANNWRFLRIGRDEYGVNNVPVPAPAMPEPVQLYRLQSDGPVESHVLPEGMEAASVFGVTADRLVGLITSPREDRAYVTADPEGYVVETFAPEASVVEEMEVVTDVDEWERRPIARAWHVSDELIAVAFEVTHTYWRGDFGRKAAVTEDLWVIDADGVRVERLAQLPGDDPSSEVQERGFTEDGAHYVWTQAGNVFAVALDDFERVDLASAF